VSEPEDPAPGGAEERVDLSGLSRLSDRPPPPKGERTIRLLRGLSVLLLALAAAGLPWYFVTRGGGKSEGIATSSPRATATASPSPSPSASPATYEVVNVGTACLRIREQPSTTAPVVTCVGAGVHVRGDGRTQQVESRLWRYVTYPPRKLSGWAAADYLKPTT